MLPKSKLKNQVVISPPKTRSMAAKEKSNLDKENISAVQDVVNVTKRRREVIKPLQDKKDPPVTVNVTKLRRDAIKPLEEKNDTVEDAKQAKKNERSNSVVETIPTISHVTTRRMREKQRRSKSDSSENRILRKTNVQTQLNKIAGTKPKTTTNTTPLQNKQFVETRKMTVLEAIPQILTSSNVTIRKKVVAATELENKAQTKSTDKEAFKEQRKPSGIKDSENVPGIKDSENVPGIKDSENVPGIKDSEYVPKIVESEDVVEIADTEDVATSLWAKPLTPLHVHKKYDRSLLKSITPHHQSTPVRQAKTTAFSPWRVFRRELPSSSSMDLELSIIVPIDDTKDNSKGNKGKTIEEVLQQSDKPKAVSDDIKNCFGLNVDDSNDDDDAAVKDAMSNPVPKIRESLPSINLSIIETLKDRHRANKQPISKCETKISKESTARRLKQPKTVTEEQFGNFGSAEVKPRIEKQNEVQNNKAKVQPKVNYFRKLSILGQPDKNSQKPSASNSKSSDEVPVLFETNWPTRD